MTDGVEILETKRNKADMEGEIDEWLTANDVEIDSMEIVLRGRNRVLVAIAYTNVV